MFVVCKNLSNFVPSGPFWVDWINLHYYRCILYTSPRFSDRHADRSLRLEHILWLWKSMFFTEYVTMTCIWKSITSDREQYYPYQYSIHNIVLYTVTRLLDRHADRSLRLEHILWLWKSTFFTESVNMLYNHKRVT